MEKRQVVQNGFACGRYFDQDPALVVGVAASADQKSGSKAIKQPDHTVVIELQSIRQPRDGRTRVRRSAFQRQQQLMMLWFDASVSRGIFAGTQEAPDLIAEFSQGGVVDAFAAGARWEFDGGRIYHIVLRYYRAGAPTIPAP